MKLQIPALLTCMLLAFFGAGVHAAPTPPKKPAPAPQSASVKDLAIREVRPCDTNHNGRIDGSEMMAVRQVWKSNPNSYLYLFDDNGDKYLEDSELSKIELDGVKKPASTGKKTDPKKKKK